jgi:hypothetical protein
MSGVGGGKSQADMKAEGSVPANPGMPRSESVEPPCDCPPGWQHEPDCPVVTGQKP